jgi:HsdM N-terminal domain
MFEQAFKNIDDVLWKEAGCTTELDYTEQTSWLLFLKYLDEPHERVEQATLRGDVLSRAITWSAALTLRERVQLKIVATRQSRCDETGHIGGGPCNTLHSLGCCLRERIALAVADPNGGGRLSIVVSPSLEWL